ncbi:oligopeptide/dipeptide ABC transporter ATP-binding protein, partial [Haladaptatus sp. AB643]|uniref:oligopeptide/dipeptide ABC transporter ATP-binding protein n=1 Tax=Haladaptatus sp. AB643 TaxID=2934174 RepID=UPI0028090678|nr:ABC transporter ATP-binding protein [Haladaptatus sp. AB643]
VGPSEEIVNDAAHPYTRALLNSTPSLNAPLEEMRPIEGQSPAPINVPKGCAYHPRCPLATDECVQTDPPFDHPTPEHAVACYHWQEAQEEIELNYEELLQANQIESPADERGENQ